jgi:hypothetical protein
MPEQGVMTAGRTDSRPSEETMTGWRVKRMHRHNSDEFSLVVHGYGVTDVEVAAPNACRRKAGTYASHMPQMSSGHDHGEGSNHMTARRLPNRLDWMRSSISRELLERSITQLLCPCPKKHSPFGSRGRV